MRTLISGLILFGTLAVAHAGPETESFGPGQAIADELRSATGAAIAWIPAGMLVEAGRGDLSTFVQFGTDEISVVRLTGKQVRQALERSVSLFPDASPSFLQVSGLEVVFSKGANPDGRVRTVLVEGVELNATATYEVAMPGNVARGGLGYFTVWDRKAISRTLENATLESLLKGKSGFVRTARWKVVD